MNRWMTDLALGAKWGLRGLRSSRGPSAAEDCAKSRANSDVRAATGMTLETRCKKSRRVTGLASATLLFSSWDITMPLLFFDETWRGSTTNPNTCVGSDGSEVGVIGPSLLATIRAVAPEWF